MGVSSVELWQRIAASQLASPLLCRTWAADAAAVLSATEAIEGARVGEQLVKQGKLTQFQIESLLGENKLPLIRHGYRILEPVDYAPYPAPHVRSIWHDWWAVAKTPTAPTLWMRWLQVDEFKQPALAQSNPALPRALQQSQVRHERLQTVQPPEMASGTLQLCVEPMQGQLLTGLCNGQALSLDRVVALLTEVADALAPLHAYGLAHGRLTPDRICVNPTGQHQLLRDPLCSATLHMQSGKLPAPSGLLMAQLPGKLQAAHFMAPEFLLPAQVSTPQSDIYSLGCIAWLMLAGNAPYNAKQPEQVLAAHAEQPLDTAQLGNVPEPIAKCLWHCLAKNPGARFQKASQLAEALREAQNVVARGRTTRPKAVAKPAMQTAVVAAPVVAAQPVIEPTVVPTKNETIAPVVSKPSSQPGGSQPVAAKAVEEKPVATKDAQPKSAPSQPAPSKAVETKPAPAKPTEPTQLTQPAASQPAVVIEPKPAASTKPVQAAPPSPAPIGSAPQPVSATTPGAVAPVAIPTPTPSATASTSVTPTAAQPAKPQKRLAQPGKPPGRRTAVRKTKKSKGVNWLTPVIGGGALLILILVVTVMSGGLGSSGNSASNKPDKNNTTNNQGQNTQTAQVEPVKVDPLAEKYELVSDVPTALWAPPRIAEPLSLDLLPPGGQFFAAVRPARLFAQPESKQLLSLLDSDLSPLWKWITDSSGVTLEQIDQVILVAYPNENGAPQTALRIKLKEAQTLSQLKAKWQSPVDTKVKEQSLLVSGPRAFYIQQQPLVESQSVTEFAVGPTELMREAAESQGATTAMTGQMEQLHQATDQAADINLLVNPVFFYTEGRAWLDQSPPRFRAELEKWATREMRGMLLTTSLSEPWYYELRLVGATDREVVGNMQKLNDVKHQLPQTIESWLVSELPHPHWRAMANRFPNMLRALDTQTRVGAENGQTIANGYLPIAAATNLLYASWMAVQPGATASAGTVAANTPSGTDTAASTPLTPTQILDRKITLKMDQTGIENVLQAIGEQANDKLPAGTKAMPFELDGPGFQRAGITRNQQIKPNFEVTDVTVREALIALSKKGNPVQPLNDIKSDDQKLIWVLIDGDNPEKSRVSLTSREAALAAGYKLPAEYTK